jgi:NAD(P)-dependent dehydrogenase (short-subunit alcohol dehydrogenase family)/rhamnose utilization protein RhaD (predicted bifunctional aldolase and dehydrogenase)
MRPEISELIEISNYYGTDKEYVIAGGGNTSFKDDSTIWIKASGYPLSTLCEDDLVALDRQKLRLISGKTYPDDPTEREELVKGDLYAGMTDRGKGRRPSVETSLHEIIGFRFVVHLHPAKINGVLCSRNARNTVAKLFGDKVLFVPYTDPGYTLFKKLESDIASYRNKFNEDPHIIMLENHGVFVSADTTGEIRKIYEDILAVIVPIINPLPEIEDLPFNPVLTRVLPSVRMQLSTGTVKTIRFRHNTLISRYYGSQQEYHKISLPLTPDNIVYCKSRYLYVEQSSTAERIIESVRQQLPRFFEEYGFYPKMIIIKNAGILAVEDSVSQAETLLDVYEDMIKVSHYSALAGGPKFLSPDQVAFIDKWEVENYRRKVAGGNAAASKLSNKTAIVTGGAQGFGAGISGALFMAGLNVVVADLNEEAGQKFTKTLVSTRAGNKAMFARVDVSDPASVRDLVMAAVREFGGLDLMISNAGVLKAGGLDEMDPESFSRTTGINYNGYFYCAKYASEIMKIQNSEKPEYFTDIIQINSKSGLRGSNRNFAYSGGKFGGIGLTQSFALELAPFRIKVNAICPGNYYEGPLWSDPQTGLFVQYLKTGKVQGAKTIDDVRKFYEQQVPLNRGCRLEDVVKAMLYIIDQEYETGQAVPVTGGQVMLG